jgi:hypothetical protein
LIVARAWAATLRRVGRDAAPRVRGAGTRRQPAVVSPAMKNVLSIASTLCIGLALTLTACGKEKKAAPAAEPAKTEPAPAPAAAAPTPPPAAPTPAAAEPAAPAAAPAAPAAGEPKAEEKKADDKGGW